METRCFIELSDDELIEFVEVNENQKMNRETEIRKWKHFRMTIENNDKSQE